MIRSRKAGIEDIPLIRNLAERSFLPTYKEILSADQLEKSEAQAGAAISGASYAGHK